MLLGVIEKAKDPRKVVVMSEMLQSKTTGLVFVQHVSHPKGFLVESPGI